MSIHKLVPKDHQFAVHYNAEVVPTLDTDTIVVRIYDPNGNGILCERFCLATEHGVYLPEWEDSDSVLENDIHSVAVEYFSELEKYQLPEDSPRNLRRAATCSADKLNRIAQWEMMDEYDL